MISYKQALVAKEKFKKLYWKENFDRFNVIAIHTNEDKHSSIKIYLFNVNDTEGLPKSIDEVDIIYMPVFEKAKEE